MVVAILLGESDGIVLNTAIVSAVAVALTSVIVFLFKMLMAARDREYDRIMKEKDDLKKSYQDIASEAIKSQTDMVNHMREREGKPPIVPVAPVVPESHSIPTLAQEEMALVATMRATLAATKLLIGQEPREVDKEIELHPDEVVKIKGKGEPP